MEAGKQGRKAAISVLAVLVILVGGLFAVRDVPSIQQNPVLSRFASVFALKSALGPRTTIWHMAIEGIKEEPVFGWGQEGYNYIFNQYYQPSLYAQEPWFDRAHDIFLDWAVAGGIPALLLFLAALLTAAWSLYRAPVSRHERVLLLSALFGYGVQGLAVFDNLFTYIPLVAILAMAHVLSSRPLKLMERMPEVNDTKLDTLVGPAAIVVGALLVWFVNVPSVLASQDLIQGLTSSNTPDQRLAAFQSAVNEHGLGHQEIVEQLVSTAAQESNDAQASQQTRQGLVDLAGKEMNAELARAPKDARLRLQYAVFLRAIGDIKDAQLQSAAARQYSPKKQIIITEQGIEAFQAGNYAAAKEFFTQAYQLNTNYQDPLLFIAAADIAGGNTAGGKALLQQTYGTTTVPNQMLIIAYYQVKDWNDLIDVVKAFITQSDDVNMEFQLVAAYYQAGRLNDAVTELHAIGQAHPEAQQEVQALLKQLHAQ